MNFSRIMNQGDVLVELKYCERCGGLWLRRPGDEESYCVNCRAAMSAWPQIGTRARGRKTGGTRARRGAQKNVPSAATSEQFVLETLCGVAEKPAENFDYECLPTMPEVRL